MLGDQNDALARLKAVLPTGWFPDITPILDGVLSGIAAIWAWVWSLLNYVFLQQRLATATDVNLDLISTDYLGTTLPRRAAESDTSYRARIKAARFQEMGTRAAISNALTLLNGAVPQIFEPANATDTGGWGAKGSRINTGLCYGASGSDGGGVGGYGSYSLPFQAFIITNLPIMAIGSGVEGYGFASQGTSIPVIGAYGTGSIEYASGTTQLLSASDQDVYDTINSVRPIATIMWVSTQNTSPQGGSGGVPELDTSFVLNVSRLS